MNLKQFKGKRPEQKKVLKDFLVKLDTIVPEDFQELVNGEDEQTWKETDCLSCANCCKTMTPTFTASDINRIAAYLSMSPAAFRKKWLYKEPKDGDWVNTATPCQFLGSDNKCTIYEVRPVDCAEFPHHFKQPFDAYNDTYTQNLDYCPATYLLVERLKKRVEREYEW